MQVKVTCGGGVRQKTMHRESTFKDCFEVAKHLFFFQEERVVRVECQRFV